MGPWTYYLPFIVGLLLPFGLHQAFFASPRMVGLEVWQQWSLLGLSGLGLAVTFQALMIGAQGAFAQVLPVPFGKSVRGRSAVVAGGGLIATVLVGLVALFLYDQGSSGPGLIAAVVTGVAALISLTAYVWSWPMAVRDFASR